MAYYGTTPLFAPGPNPRAPALPWRSDDFYAVDDRVRGGTSHSHMGIVQYPPNSRGEIIFSGFLDTTTLGGAGFASQASSKRFPVPLAKERFQGLRIVVRKQPSWTEPSNPPSDGSIPGGGKAPVTSFVFEIKTQEPPKRPDGRRESVVVWEWSFGIPQQDGVQDDRLNTQLTNDDFWVFDSTWDDFKPMYRGRPVDPDTAGEFKPEETYEWSLMARSNFQSQSGPFTLQLHSLSALPVRAELGASNARAVDVHEQTGPADAAWADEKGLPAHSFRAVGPAEGAPVARTTPSSGEYYGFALFIFATVLWIGWVLWALLPDSVLLAMGITWYPNREWAFLLPAWSLFAVLAVYAVFIATNLRNTPELDDIANVTDSHQNVLHVEMSPSAHTHLFEDQEKLRQSMHDIYDLPPTYVSRQTHL
ncbi:FOG: RRM domain [Moesziomyces antarcticus T-34]|uniref:FOG: RRM domain n=1 Tax=Pseudozyma antarctica (strain T-34) TaxID=1151754 RepID=M9LJ51_PSEA3|nr:FOG: RRM domain [Moesziomyces antarcticus T-34]